MSKATHLRAALIQKQRPPGRPVPASAGNLRVWLELASGSASRRGNERHRRRRDHKRHRPRERAGFDVFKVTAARMRVLSASSSISSPSWKSMARRVFPSRLELNRREGSFSAAPFAKVIFTTFL